MISRRARLVAVVLRSAVERQTRGALDRAAADVRGHRRPAGSARARVRLSRLAQGARTGQVEALLRIDARLEPIIAQLTQQYTANYQKSTSVESRLWHSVFDLVKAFTAAYQIALKAGYPRATTSAGARSCRGSSCASRTTGVSTASTGCSATATGSPRNGASSTSSTNSRACAAGSASSWSSAWAAFRKPGVSFEQEYLKTLLLMRLDSGNFTPDQVEWVARQLEDWTPTLALTPAAVGRRALLRRPDRDAGPAPPRPPAQRRAHAVPRREPRLRAHRRAHALAARARRGASPSRATSRRASSGCC